MVFLAALLAGKLVEAVGLRTRVRGWSGCRRVLAAVSFDFRFRSVAGCLAVGFLGLCA